MGCSVDSFHRASLQAACETGSSQDARNRRSIAEYAARDLSPDTEMPRCGAARWDLLRFRHAHDIGARLRRSKAPVRRMKWARLERVRRNALSRQNPLTGAGTGPRPQTW